MESSEDDIDSYKQVSTAYLQEIIRGKPGKLFFLSGSKALIGRNIHAEIPISSCNVSRNHALLNYTKKGWSITDNKSINGIFINGKKLKPGTPHLLSTNETIFIGPPDITDFVYSYHFISSPKRKNVPVQRPTDDENEIVDIETPCCSIFSQAVPYQLSKMRCRRSKRVACSESETSVGHSSQNGTLDMRNSENGVEMTLQDHIAVLNTRLQTNEVLEKRIKRKLHENNATFNESIDANDLTCPNQESESLLPEHDNVVESQPYSWDIPVDDYMYLTYPSTISTIESSSSRDDENGLDSNSNSSGGECKKSECKSDISELKVQLAKLQEQLHQKEQISRDLEKQLQDKDNKLKEQEEEKKLLEKRESEAIESKLKNSKFCENFIKEEVANQFGKLMETEFTCSICTELFIKATTLGCSHTFCHKCITYWKRKKKQCPICRAVVVKESHSLVIDGLIEKMVEKLSSDFQERRAAVIKDREEAARRGHAKGKRRSTRSTTINNQNAQEPQTSAFFTNWTPLMPEELLMPDDDEEMSILSILQNNYFDESEDNEDSPVEGYGYYGGHGRCYNCGRTGHWANGCPDM